MSQCGQVKEYMLSDDEYVKIFGKEALNNRIKKYKMSDKEIEEKFKLIVPNDFIADREADRYLLYRKLHSKRISKNYHAEKERHRKQNF